jgi:hypothetical protein
MAVYSRTNTTFELKSGQRPTLLLSGEPPGHPDKKINLFFVDAYFSIIIRNENLIINNINIIFQIYQSELFINLNDYFLMLDTAEKTNKLSFSDCNLNFIQSGSPDKKAMKVFISTRSSFMNILFSNTTIFYNSKFFEQNIDLILDSNYTTIKNVEIPQKTLYFSDCVFESIGKAKISLMIQQSTLEFFGCLFRDLSFFSININESVLILENSVILTNGAPRFIYEDSSFIHANDSELYLSRIAIIGMTLPANLSYLESQFIFCKILENSKLVIQELITEKIYLKAVKNKLNLNSSKL